MNFIQRWRLRRRILEGSEVVEERIRRRLENLQQKLEKRREDLEEQAKRQDERGQQQEERSRQLDERISVAKGKLENKRMKLAERVLQENAKLAERAKNQEQSIAQRLEQMEAKRERLAERESNIEARTADLDERRDNLDIQLETIQNEKSKLLALKHKVRDEIDRHGKILTSEIDSDLVSLIDFGGFDEGKFTADFNALLDNRAFEDALDHVIGELPTLARSNLNRKEILNHLLFTNRQLQHGGIAKHGWEKLLRKATTANRAFDEANIDKNSTFLELGCGAHDPIALSAYYYLNGFNRAIGCDLQDARNQSYSALSMYDIIARMNLVSDEFRIEGTHPSMFKTRLSELEAEKFINGHWPEALNSLQGRVEHMPMNVLDLPVSDSELGFVVSMAVLEHVEDIDAVMEWLYRKSKPGAVQFHFIDLADHRSYMPSSGADAWTFLTEKTAPQGMNRLRKSEHITAIEKAGFRILSANDSQEELPAETAAALINPWKSMSEDDLTTTKLTVIIQK